MTIITAPRATKPRAISIDGEEVMEEVLLPKVVEEDVRLVEEQLPARGTMDELPQGRILQLKFLDRVSEPVQTGNVLRGINDECLKLALVNSAEEIVSCGPAEAEIVLLDAGNGIITHENFKRRIIKTGEKKKPHFTKRVFIDLKEGVGDLAGLQLGQDSGWTKNCYCRLGATLVQSPGGIVARSAWTPPFKVGDKRNTRNRKHESPLLSSEVWRLKGIGRNGVPSKRLEERNIETVQDFLFWLYVKPKELKQILGFGGILWKNVVTHAKECFIDDERMYSFKSSNKPQTSVVYDAVGRLKGLIKESHFVATDNLSADEKDDARELLFSALEGSAFRERYDSPFDIEASLPQRSSGITNASLQQCSNGSLLTFSENVGGYQTRERGSSSQSILDPADVPFLDPEVTDGLLWLDNHCYPTSRPSEKDKGNVEPFNYTMHHVLMAGESSSRHSNASFCSLDSMEFLCGDDDDEYWGTNDWLSQGPLQVQTPCTIMLLTTLLATTIEFMSMETSHVLMSLPHLSLRLLVLVETSRVLMYLLSLSPCLSLSLRMLVLVETSRVLMHLLSLSLGLGLCLRLHLRMLVLLETSRMLQHLQTGGDLRFPNYWSHSGRRCLWISFVATRRGRLAKEEVQWYVERR